MPLVTPKQLTADRATSLDLGMPPARDEHAERADAGGGAMSDPIEASMDAAVSRLVAAKARAEERDQASLAALLRIESGQKAVRDDLAVVRECLERIDKVLARAAGDPPRDSPTARGDGEVAPRLRRLLVAAVLLVAAATAAWMGAPYWPWQ